MGFSHERGAAIRTILRMRALGNKQAIEDAETAASGYLSMDDFDEYVGYHAPDGLPDDDPMITLLRERDQYKNAALQLESDAQDALARTLELLTDERIADPVAAEAAACIAQLERAHEQTELAVRVAQQFLETTGL